MYQCNIPLTVSNFANSTRTRAFIIRSPCRIYDPKSYSSDLTSCPFFREAIEQTSGAEIQREKNNSLHSTRSGTQNAEPEQSLAIFPATSLPFSGRPREYNEYNKRGGDYCAVTSDGQSPGNFSKAVAPLILVEVPRFRGATYRVHCSRFEAANKRFAGKSRDR